MSVAGLLAAPQLRPHRPLPMQVTGSAVISECLGYRWALRRFWTAPGSPENPPRILPWIMLNPSTADGSTDDQTLHRIIGFSWRWGFDGLLVVNLWPFRSPKPSVLQEWLRWSERQDWSARDAIWANQNHIADLLRPFDAAMAAWGAPGGKLGFATTLAAESLFDVINDPDAKTPRMAALKVFCLGETGSGEPTHPMARGRHRVPDDRLPAPMRRYPGIIVGLGAEVLTPSSNTFTGARP